MAANAIAPARTTRAPAIPQVEAPSRASVILIRSAVRMRQSSPARRDGIAPAEVLLEPHVEDDEHVSAAHLTHPELRRPDVRLVHEIGITRYSNRDDRLQRQLDGQVEVVREQRINRLDHLTPVGLEGIRRVVVTVQEDRPDEEVGEAVDEELQPRVVAGPPARHEARAERAVPALLEDGVVAAEVLRVVGAVGHEDRHGVAGELVEPGTHGQPETVAVVGREAAH